MPKEKKIKENIEIELSDLSSFSENKSPLPEPPKVKDSDKSEAVDSQKDNTEIAKDAEVAKTSGKIKKKVKRRVQKKDIQKEETEEDKNRAIAEKIQKSHFASAIELRKNGPDEEYENDNKEDKEEKKDEKSKEKLDQKIEEKKEKNKEEAKTEEKVEAKIEDKAEDNAESKAEEKVEAKSEDKAEAKVEEKVEAKVEDKGEAKSKDKVEAKTADEIEAAKKEKVEAIIEEKKEEEKNKNKEEDEKETKKQDEEKEKAKNKIKKKANGVKKELTKAQRRKKYFPKIKTIGENITKQVKNILSLRKKYGDTSHALMIALPDTIASLKGANTLVKEVIATETGEKEKKKKERLEQEEKDNIFLKGCISLSTAIATGIKVFLRMKKNAELKKLKEEMDKDDEDGSAVVDAVGDSDQLKTREHVFDIMEILHKLGQSTSEFIVAETKGTQNDISSGADIAAKTFEVSGDFFDFVRHVSKMGIRETAAQGVSRGYFGAILNSGFGKSMIEFAGAKIDHFLGFKTKEEIEEEKRKKEENEIEIEEEIEVDAKESVEEAEKEVEEKEVEVIDKKEKASNSLLSMMDSLTEDGVYLGSAEKKDEVNISKLSAENVNTAVKKYGRVEKFLSVSSVVPASISREEAKYKAKQKEVIKESIGGI